MAEWLVRYACAGSEQVSEQRVVRGWRLDEQPRQRQYTSAAGQAQALAGGQHVDLELIWLEAGDRVSSA